MMENFFTLYASAVLPSAVILALACIVLLFTVFCKHKADNWVYYVSQIGLLATIALLFRQYHCFPDATIIAHGRFRIDHLSLLASITILLLSFCSLFYTRRELTHQKLPVGEYYALCLFSILGMIVMTNAYHFLTLYIALELMSFPLYVLSAYYRGSSKGTEAALKYFITGALASGFLLYGISLVYGVTHSLSFVDIGIAASTISSNESLMFLVGIAFILAGLAFKLGLAPFHMWLPDVYEGAPSSLVVFIASAPKIAVFILLARLLQTAFLPLFDHWHYMLALLAILSMLLGNIAALTQKNIWRLFAYSSIAQMGFIVMGLSVGNLVGMSAALFYVISYAIVSLGSFAILTLLRSQGVRIETVQDLAGLSKRYPVAAFVMLLLVFSMAGIPPLVGFMAKLSLLLVLISAHQIAMAVFMSIISIVGAYYYLSIIKAIYFDEPTSSLAQTQVSKNSSMPLISLIGLFALLLGIFPAPLFQLCQFVLF